MKTQRDARVVVIGGGTGSFALLSALKHYTPDITALVSMADDGGSTGVLRDELGVLPPGDVRQCLVALSDSPKVRDLFSYRFDEGSLKGHAFGNLFLTALEKLTGSFAEAVETASEVLRVEGRVVPITLDNVRLSMKWTAPDHQINGEGAIDTAQFAANPRKASLSLTPEATANPAALEAIDSADLVVIAPGDIYTSLGQLLIIQGVGEALLRAMGKVVYVCNLVTKHGHTDGFTVSDHAAEIERFAGYPILDYVLYNKERPADELASRYINEEQAYGVKADQEVLDKAHYKAVGGYFVADGPSSDLTFIRHDGDAVAQELVKLYL